MDKKERQRLATQRYRLKKAKENGTEHRIGIGKGGGQPKGKESPHYKTGIRYFHKRAKQLKDELNCCQRCDKDLTNASKDQWCVHHKDHDRSNNEDSNFELLCKRCHQIEHECWKAFEGATTIREE